MGLIAAALSLSPCTEVQGNRKRSAGDTERGEWLGGQLVSLLCFSEMWYSPGREMIWLLLFVLRLPGSDLCLHRFSPTEETFVLVAVLLLPTCFSVLPFVCAGWRKRQNGDRNSIRLEGNGGRRVCARSAHSPPELGMEPKIPEFHPCSAASKYMGNPLTKCTSPLVLVHIKDDNLLLT